MRPCKMLNSLPSYYCRCCCYFDVSQFLVVEENLRILIFFAGKTGIISSRTNVNRIEHDDEHQIVGCIGIGHDLSVTTFSPDGRVFQIGTGTGFKCKDGIVMGVEKLVAAKMMMLPGSKKRIHPVHRHFRHGFHVDGFQEDISLTKDEELEIENELQRLNKPALKTVKTSYGDLYDCVDFYKQPAFDNPLLKNHKYHPGMRPLGHRSVSERLKGNTRSKHGQVKLETVDCPFGTVPIRRVTKEELVRTKLNKKRYALKHGVLTDEEPGVHYAIARTKNDGSHSTWYTGASAFISVYNVTVDDPRQYSLARIRLYSGTDSIEVGTMSNPGIYNNSDTHIFIRTKTASKDEFNMRGNSFVQVLQGSPIDMRITPVSERGKTLVNAKFSVEYDGKNWWFYFDDGPARLTMGFWSDAAFTQGLNGLATDLDWGGEVSGPKGIPSAPMGSSRCPVENTKQDGYFLLMKVITRDSEQESDAVDLVTVCDDRFYDVIDEGVVNSYDGHLIFFGGPGPGPDRRREDCRGNI